MDQQTVISALLWAFGVVGTGFILLLTWFAVRVVTQLDRLTELVTQELHKIDRRLVRVETRLGMDKRGEDEAT